MPTDHGIFRDTQELSHTLRHTNVSAMQISRGSFEAQLSTLATADWTIHFIKFSEGAALCAGDAPRDRHAIVVPLTVAPKSRLLGRELAEDTIGVYAPGAEHADATFAGQEIAVLFPNDAAFLDADLQAGRLPVTGSHLWTVSRAQLDCLRQSLAQLAAVSRSPPGASSPAGASMPSDCMSCVLSTTLETASATALPAKGRPRLSRATAFRSVFEVLEAHGDDVVQAGQLAKEVGVSPASLQRMFLERFGVPPSRYLIMRRHYLARQRLKSGAAPSVTDAASSLGFWDMSRFAKTYRSLFGEYPSDTLRKSRR